jgi:hypothetical protein
MAEAISTLSISPDKVCFIVLKARAFDAKDVVTDPGEGSNPIDDGMVEVLEDHLDDPVVREITGVIGAMSEDEQIDLVTLAWLGRGDGDAAEWHVLRAEAARVHNPRIALHLLGMPLLPTYLEEGLSMLGLSCDEFDAASCRNRRIHSHARGNPRRTLRTRRRCRLSRRSDGPRLDRSILSN